MLNIYTYTLIYDDVEYECQKGWENVLFKDKDILTRL